MERIIETTLDGSNTLSVPSLGTSYHSRYGALAESRHIFLGAGLGHYLSINEVDCLSILEMGFGTGLNALLTLLEAERLQQKIHYQAVELYPIGIKEAKALGHDGLLGSGNRGMRLHGAEWGKAVAMNEWFTMEKWHTDLIGFKSERPLHLVYFDAFDAVAQPRLWQTDVFENFFRSMVPQGVLTTYASKVSVRRAMEAAGWLVEKIPGPRGKREITRAVAHKTD